ncbi:MAG: M43 family zinc metalloprotease [Bacteroidota bacterium]|nr:M43 family zinc metalloprotease [Bacteroidota bacterium]
MKTTNKIMKCYLLIILLSFSGFVFAQNGKFIRSYATQKANLKITKNSSEIKEQKSQIERHIKSIQNKVKFKKIIIPIVFHVLYVDGDRYPDEDQVYSQLDALNRDFANKATRYPNESNIINGFAKVAEDSEIQFCIATGKSGNKEEFGLRFIPTKKLYWSGDEKLKSEKTGGVSPWSTKDYLNVWVVRLDDTVSGYAQMPGGPSETDGIVIDYRFFGTIGTAQFPYNEGKTLTHLVGNYLGLYDLWREDSPCADDFVNDTPIHNAPNYGNPKYRHISLCSNFPVEMTMNFMDNSDDRFLNMFTIGQKYRMHSILAEGGPRFQLSKQETSCRKQDLSITSNKLKNFISLNQESLVNSLDVKAYPNPAEDQVWLEINSAENIDFLCIVYDALGRECLKVKNKLYQGTNLELLNTEQWSNGVYSIHVFVGQKIEVIRVIISKD